MFGQHGHLLARGDEFGPAGRPPDRHQQCSALGEVRKAQLLPGEAHDAIALGHRQAPPLPAQPRGKRDVMMHRSSGHHDGQRRVGAIDRRTKPIGQFDVGEIQRRVDAQPLQQASRPALLLGHEQLPLGQVCLGHDGGDPVGVLGDEPRELDQRLGLVVVGVAAKQLPAQLVGQPERGQEVLQANALGSSGACPGSQRVEIARRRHHARGQEAPPAPEIALDAVEHIGVGLVRQAFERLHVRIELRRHLPCRLAARDPRHDRGRLSAYVANSRAHPAIIA